MEALIRKILDELANDPRIHATNINIEERKVGTLFKKRTTLHIFGSVSTGEERDAVTRVAKSSAGESVEIVNDLAVKHHETGASV